MAREYAGNFKTVDGLIESDTIEAKTLNFGTCLNSKTGMECAMLFPRLPSIFKKLSFVISLRDLDNVFDLPEHVTTIELLNMPECTFFPEGSLDEVTDPDISLN